MSCKDDCIHYNVCNYHIDEETPFEVTECNNFKNKADFVEVVRCKDCKHRKNGIQGYYCDLTDFLIKDDDFCSYGERRDNGAKMDGGEDDES